MIGQLTEKGNELEYEMEQYRERLNYKKDQFEHLTTGDSEHARAVRMLREIVVAKEGLIDR
jgi:hypothetical protein